MATLNVYSANDLSLLVATLDQPYAIAWSHERLGHGAGQFTIPHDSPVVVANPSVLQRDNIVLIEDTPDPFGFVIRRRQRTRGDVWDPIQVTGPGLAVLLNQAVVYMVNGLAGAPSDYRKFAWMAYDYQLGAGWEEPTSLGTYRNPTDPSLAGDPGQVGTNEIQRLILDPDQPPFPWGSSYPSPGGLGGTWQLTFRGQTTAPIQWDTGTAGVKAALEGLSSIDQVTVTGGGTSGDPWLVEFTGSAVEERPHPLMGMIHDDLRHDHGVTHVARVQGGAEAVEGESLVDGWPDDRAEWFGNFGVVQHYRRVLDVEAAPSAAGDAILAVVSLGPVDVWFDGEHLGDGDELDLLEFRLELYETQHVIGIRAQAPTLVTIIRDLGGGEYGGVLYRSFTPGVFGGAGSPEPWQVFGPDTPPGVTPGFILSILFDEAQERGYLPSLSRTFDADEDSTGQEWPKRTEIGLQVGDDTVLSTSERLRDLGVTIDVSNGLAFSAYAGVRVDRGNTPDDGVSMVTVGLARAHELRVETEDEYLNALLVRTEDAWLEQHIATGDARREGFVALGLIPSAASGSTLALDLLHDLIQPRLLIGWALHSTQDDGPMPGVSYQVGDVIVGPRLSSTLLTGEWTTGDTIVDSIAAQIDVAGGILWVHEVSLPT